MVTNFIRILALTLLCLFTQADHAFAQASAVMKDGSVAVGYDSRTCNSTLQGAIRFNSTTNNLAYCNANAGQWVGPICGLGCAAPSSCSAPGLICPDGSIFIGFLVYAGNSCKPVFAAGTNQSTGSNWRSSGSGSDTGSLSMRDGNANQNWIAANRTIANYPAFNICDGLVAHGYSDWYLPARDELQLIFKAPGIGTNVVHWTSTETSATNAWTKQPVSGAVTDYAKNTNRYVRCVRRN